MPHPFDRMHTIPDPATLLRVLDRIDIFEVYNSRLLFDAFNDDAMRFAAKYNLIQAAGSDAHVLPGIGTALNQIPAFDGPGGVPARDAPEPDRPPPEEPPVSSGAEVGPEREQVEASGARPPNTAMGERGRGPDLRALPGEGDRRDQRPRARHRRVAARGASRRRAGARHRPSAGRHPAPEVRPAARRGAGGCRILRPRRPGDPEEPPADAHRPADAVRDGLRQGGGRARRRRPRALPHVAHARDPHHPAAHGGHDGRRRPRVPRLDPVPAVGARRRPRPARSSSGRRRSSSSTRPTSTSASTARPRSSSSGRRSRCSATGTRTSRRTEAARFAA